MNKCKKYLETIKKNVTAKDKVKLEIRQVGKLG